MRPSHDQPLTLTRSHELLAQARQLIPGLTQSMMKRPDQFAPEEFPVYLARGHGAEVVDVDGQRYVDFICGLGANSLGHGHPAIEAAIRGTLEQGLLHSLPTALEVDATRDLVALVPHAEMARFFKSGAEATSAAVRLARAATGRAHIITVGYNGWHDHFMYDTPGVPAAVAALTERLPLFQPSDEAALIDAVTRRGPELAAVVLSIPYNRTLEPELFRDLRAACDATGCLLVLDEIVTGFRLALGGAQEHFGVRADITCFSKALAAGMPLSAVVGRRDLLSGLATLQVSTTFGGELLSLAACRAALQTYRQSDHVEHIARLGRRLREGIDEAARRAGASLRVRGYDALPMFLFAPSPDRHGPVMRQLQGQLARRGFLLRRDLNFLCSAHTEQQIDDLVLAVAESLAVMKAQGICLDLVNG